MPTVANGIDLDYAFHRASGQNVELELRGGPGTNFNQLGRKGAIRILGFVNHANMGDYRDQINLFLAKTPDDSSGHHGASAADNREIRSRDELRAGGLQQRADLGAIWVE